MDAPIPDPYLRCETHCNHDLSRGVLVSDLMADDGPYPPSQLIVSLSSHQAVLLDDEQREMTGQQIFETREAV
jgi:hypothetical protein